MSATLNRKLSEVHQLLHSGDFRGAQILCRDLLQRTPRNPDALCLLAITYLATGRPGDAVPILQQSLGSEPRHGAALENLGLAHLMLGTFAEAERALRTAAALPGAPATVMMRLGLAILNQGRVAEAIEVLQDALKREPDNPDIHLNLGQARGQTGDAAGARQHFETALQLAPGHAHAMFNLGVLCLNDNQLAQARLWFEGAIAQSPQHADALVNLGVVHEKGQQLEDAVACFRRALKINPALAAAGNNLARALALQGKLEESREQYLATLRIAPNLIEGHEGMASTCLALGRFKEAIVHLREILRAEPANDIALNAIAEALLQTGDLADATACANQANVLDPSKVGPYVVLAEIYSIRGDLDLTVTTLESGYRQTGAGSLLGKLAYVLRQQCAWEKWRGAWAQLSATLASTPEIAIPFSLLCEPTTAAQQLANACKWSEISFGSTPKVGLRGPLRADHRRLRIGYFSSDFYQHATAYLLAEVLELHDRREFEIFAYSYGPDDKSPMRARLVQACEHFVDIAWDPDDIAARRIHDDDLDILIDLKGYTMGARSAILARRPCRTQASWLGYPGTMGAPFVDYLIADPFIIPEGHEQAYSERVVRLPQCYQPNDRKRAIAAPLARRQYGLPDEGFVFACFNQAYKITSEVYVCWLRLLQRVPGSVLWLREDNRWASDNLRHEADTHGIAGERIVFAPKLPLEQHLARYRIADLALDTFPYGSHTTASDALWAECLLVGLCGETFASRVAGSILTNCKLPQLVSHTLEDYERLALRIATDSRFRDGLRAQLKAAITTAPLFDAAAFTRDLEKLYREIAAKPGRGKSSY